MDKPADRGLFEHAVTELPEAKRTPHRWATLSLNEDRTCPFLDSDLRCSVHKRFGESVLSDACATFPRLVGLVGERRELAGSIACPEVARRALPTDNGTDLVEAEPEALGRGALSDELRGGAEPAARLETVRRAMYEILSTRLFPLNSRLFALAHFGHQLDELVGKRGDSNELAAAVEPFTQPAHIGGIHDLFASAPDEGAFGLGCVMLLMAGPLKSTQSPRFVELVQEVLPGYAHASSIEELWEAYSRQSRAVSPDAQARVDRMVFNYARHCCIAEWYSTFPGLRLFTQYLLLRVAAIRFLLVGHPKMAGLDPDRVDELGVRVFSGFARATERTPLVKIGILEVASQHLPTFFHAAPLLRV